MFAGNVGSIAMSVQRITPINDRAVRKSVTFVAIVTKFNVTCQPAPFWLPVNSSSRLPNSPIKMPKFSDRNAPPMFAFKPRHRITERLDNLHLS